MLEALQMCGTKSIKMINNKIYICGKITGMEEEAKVLFNAAHQELEQMGFEVVNPFMLDHNHDKQWESYMKACIKALMDCNYIYLLPNWRESRGAVLEQQIAQRLNIIKIGFN